MRAIVVVVLGLSLALVPGCGTEADSASSIARIASETTAASSGPPPHSTGTGAAPTGSSSPAAFTELPLPASTTLAADGPAGFEGFGGSGYCGALVALIGLERSDGSMAKLDYEPRYRTLLQAVIDESPPQHTPTWELFVTLVDEPFTYDNFNPAVDSLEQIEAELNASCPGVESMLVDDDGRLTSWLTIDG